MDLLTIFSVLGGCLVLYLNVVATITIKMATTLEPPQKLAQIFVVWLIPLVGALLVLHLIVETEPNLFSFKLIPFRAVSSGKKTKSSNRRDDDYWSIDSGGHHRGGREIDGD